MRSWISFPRPSSLFCSDETADVKSTYLMKFVFNFGMNEYIQYRCNYFADGLAKMQSSELAANSALYLINIFEMFVHKFINLLHHPRIDSLSEYGFEHKFAWIMAFDKLKYRFWSCVVGFCLTRVGNFRNSIEDI